jgi:hypothetical protein
LTQDRAEAFAQRHRYVISGAYRFDGPRARLVRPRRGIETRLRRRTPQSSAIWIQRKQPEKALPELRLVLKSSAGNPDLLEQIGNLEDELGNRGAALANWQQAERNATDSSMRKRLNKRIGASLQH